MKITTKVNGRLSSMNMTDDQEELLDEVFSWALRYLAVVNVVYKDNIPKFYYDRDTIKKVRRLHQRYLATTGR